MKKLLSLLLLLLFLPGCGEEASPPEEETLTIVATTYPVYLFSQALTQGVPEVTVEAMVRQPVSCLHDYTVTIQDMKLLAQADLLVCSGAGLEESMEDAFSSIPNTPRIDASQGISLLESQEGHDHAGHDHGDEEEEHSEFDPHIWLDPQRAVQMLENIERGLVSADPAHEKLYQANLQAAQVRMEDCLRTLRSRLQPLTQRGLITFHDGFSYFAQAFDLTILRAIEEEAGSEASAREVGEIVEEIQYHDLPAIFTEVNGSQAAAQIIQRECGVELYPLSLMMSGPEEGGVGLEAYIGLLTQNVQQILEAYQ